MYTKTGLLLVMAALAAGLFATNGWAEDKKDNKTDSKAAPGKSTEQSKAALDVGAAFRMAQIGRETKAPEALIAAARVIGTTNFQKVDLKDVKAEKPEAFDAAAQANALLEEAAKLAGDRADAVKALIAAARKDIAERPRGAIPGPQTRRSTLSDRDRIDTYPIRFRGGEEAIIIVNNTSNRGDIDLRVEDANGRYVDGSASDDDDASCSFYVPRTAIYYVKIKKYGSRGGVLSYVMTTN